MDLNGPLPTIAELRAYERKRNRRIRFVGQAVLTAVSLYLLFGVVFGIAAVDGDSMSPGMPKGSVVLFLRLDRQPEAGNVVILSTSDDQRHLVLRVAAKSGDSVRIDAAGGLLVNGRPEKNAEAVGKMTDVKSYVNYPMKIPVESVFVLGDNRSRALDSRELGVVNLRKLQGTVLLVLRRP